MAKDQITGLVFSENELEWTTLQVVREGLEVAGSGRVELCSDADTAEPDAVDDGSAEGSLASDKAVADQSAPVPEQLDAGVDRIKAECAALKGDITVGLSSKNVILRVVNLPIVSREEIVGMVQLQVDKFSPFPIESMVISYEILQEEENSCLVLIAAVKEEIVDSAGKPLMEAGMFPVRVDTTVLGWWKLLKDAGHVAEKGRQVILLMDSAAPEIVVLQDTLPLVFRSLSERGSLTDDEFAGEIAEEIDYTLMSLELEHGSSISCDVAVWHRGKVLETLKKRLEEGDCREVSFHSLESLPTVSEGLARRTAERDGAKLDLTPAAWRLLEKSKLFKKKVLTGAGVLFGIWVLAVLGFLGGFQYQRSRINSLTRTRDKWQEPAEEAREIRSRIVMVKRYIDTERSPLECLKIISEIQPEGIDLTSFTYRKGTMLTLAGEAMDVNRVYVFNDKLEASKLQDGESAKERFFSEVILRGPSQIRGKNKQAFTIGLKFAENGQ